jgi:hypothetical protein
MKHLPLIILLSLLSCKERKQDNKKLPGKNCDYMIQSGFQLQVNPHTHEYIIADVRKGITYYYDNDFGFWSAWPFVTYAHRFKDSCEAKSVLKDIVDEIYERRHTDTLKRISDSIQHIKDSINNDFKPVK